MKISVKGCDLMQLEEILKQLDSLFESHRIDEVEAFLIGHISEAKESNDDSARITLLNELIGFYRDMSQYEKSLKCCEEVLTLMEQLGLKDSIPYATTLINVANALRASGKSKEAKAFFEQVFVIYEGKLDTKDFRYASLYNNMSLMYQELNQYEKACDCLEKALSIAECYEEARIEVATTHTNLATSLMKLNRLEEAMTHLNAALSVFEMDEDKNFHYSGALAAMGEAKYLSGELDEAEKYYQKALQEIEKNTGKTESYQIVSMNLDAVLKAKTKIETHPDLQTQCKGLALCEAFYLEFGKPMIKEQFPEYEAEIAVGLVGHGSECFGFDDEFSKDHDFGPGFCMWLTDSLYDEIGERLEEAYQKLPKVYRGIHRIEMPKSGKRVGVFRIKDFYEGIIGTEDAPTTQNQWLFVEDYQLATATNGKVFRDDLGEFTRIRNNLLAYYPEAVRLKKIAREAALIAQSGQYNYSRMLKREEYVAAQIALTEFIKHAMAMIYLLNKKYAPFYKWMHRGLRELDSLKIAAAYLDNISRLPVGDEAIEILIQKIVELIFEYMTRQGLTKGYDTYLDNHTSYILQRIEEKPDTLIDEIVKMEWEAFDKVENLGGRAGCQDDWNTFSLMRKSQFLTWTKPLLVSYLEDLKAAKEVGWNMITEKYGRMMKSTAPEEYDKLKEHFPFVLERKEQIVEEIVKIQVNWMETLSKQYPYSCSNMRSIHTSEDSLYNTSYETYLRGELLTYSDDTLKLYGEFIVELLRQDKNLAEMTVENTATLYGYKSLSEMEAKLQKAN